MPQRGVHIRPRYFNSYHSMCTDLVDIAHLRLDKVEEQARLLMQGPRSDEQTPSRRHRFSAWKRRPYLWVVLVLVRYPIFSTNQNARRPRLPSWNRQQEACTPIKHVEWRNPQKNREYPDGKNTNC